MREPPSYIRHMVCLIINRKTFNNRGWWFSNNATYFGLLRLRGSITWPNKQSQTIPAQILMQNCCWWRDASIPRGTSSAHIRWLWKFTIPSVNSTASVGSTKLIKSALAHCCNHHWQNVTYIVRDGGNACTRCGWYIHDCWLPNTLQAVITATVFRNANLLALILGFSSTTCGLSSSISSSGCLPVSSTRKRSVFITTTVDRFKCFPIWTQSFQVSIVGTNVCLQG